MIRPFLFVACLMLTACGGGGDTTATPTPTNPPGPVSVSLSLNIEGAGSLDVSGQPSCATQCNVTLTSGSSVTLTAKPATGAEFDSWTGACASQTSASCTLSPTQAVTVTARFRVPVPTHLVSLEVSGNGQINVTGQNPCRGSCELTVTQGNTLSLQAQPDTGAVFTGWSEPCTGVEPDCRLTITEPVQLSAQFEAAPVNYPVAITQTGAGQVQVSGTSRVCRPRCDLQIKSGTELVLTAVADSGAVFSGWSAPCQNQAAECRTVVSGPLAIEASFVAAVVNTDLSVRTEGSGQIRSAALSAPCRGACTLSVAVGSRLEFSAEADEGQEFTGWDGACQGIDVCRLTVQPNNTVTARFAVKTNPEAGQNFIVVTNPHASALSQYPLQFARPFVEGEIAQFPQLVLNGNAIPTQADVKQRHPDGSVKHAIISAIIPQIAAGAALKLSFTNQATGRQQGAPDKAAMLSAPYNFDAKIEAKFDNGTAATASARTMLEQDKFSYWTQGDIATTVLIVDHSASRASDFGADTHKSVRPAFYATFWPALNKVQVRFVGEISHTAALQDQTYDLTLSGGVNNAAVLYQQAALPHQAMTRWTRQFWLGEQVPAISLNHQLAYLAKTRMVPNFDAKREISEATIAAQYKTWSGKSTQLYGAGLWMRAMATAGGRPDLGIYPAWSVRWLYSGDWRLAEIALRQAELSGAWPYHVREGDASRTFDEAKQISGLGRILSVNQGGRPTAWLPRLNWHESAERDKINPVAELAKTSWRPDVPHHPDVSSLQYMLTGDYYMLEQLMFSAAYTTMDNNAAAKNSTLGRGPTGSEGALYSGEVRGQGWALRTRVHAASLIPDAMPEQFYFQQLTRNALALWEGLYNVTDTPNKDSTLWQFARTVIAPKEFPYAAGQSSPLGQWVHNAKQAETAASDYYDMKKAAGGASPWMTHIVVLALGRAQELGFAAGPMKAFVGRVLSAPALDENFPLELLSAYRQPSIAQPDGRWLTSWSEVQDAYLPAYRQETIDRYQKGAYIDAEFGYNALIWAASSYVTDLPGGMTVWRFYHDRLADRSQFDGNPKWAIQPR